ncbi:MAG: cytochrome C [Gammaproteobacteria bacterium]|nr:MAG: cytochrome C [Gammaproteobacteria bacterium]
MSLTRRQFVNHTLALATGSFLYSPFLLGKAKQKVVIVGGGIGGATAAKYLKSIDASIDVTLIEPKSTYTTCFMTNEFLAGERSFDTLQFNYKALEKLGVNLVHDRAIQIDGDKRFVEISSGKKLPYDRCIVSPGIDFRWNSIEGYNEKVAETIPHSYQAGPQTLTLKKQLETMPDGGVVIIAPPANPFRCPPAPYERASQIAHYLKQHKPKSKILILDAKDIFTKDKLFMAGWQRHYGYGTDNSMIEWISLSQGGNIHGVDANRNTVIATAGDFKADVINIIPPQKAGKLAVDNGLADSNGWCPVNHLTFESTLKKNIHVIGDSAMADPLPKSGYAANSEAKVCAIAIVSLLNEIEPVQPSLINTCYSLIAPDDAITVSMVYGFENGKIIKKPGAGGLTPQDASDEMRKREASYARSWFNNITHDIFG